MIGFNATDILLVYDLANLAWNCLFTPILREFSGGVFSPNGVTRYSNPQKAPLWKCGNTSFEPLSVCTSAAVWPVERIEKNSKDSIKSHKSVAFQVFSTNVHRFLYAIWHTAYWRNLQNNDWHTVPWKILALLILQYTLVTITILLTHRHKHWYATPRPFVPLDTL